MADTNTTAMQARLELTLDPKQVQSELNRSANVIQQRLKQVERGAGAATTAAAARTVAQVASASAQLSQRLTQILGSGLKAGFAGAGSGIAAFLKSNTASALAFKSQLTELQTALAGVGEKLLYNVRVGGRSGYEWVDTLSQKLKTLDTSQLQRIVDLGKAAVAAWAGLKILTGGAQGLQSLATLTASIAGIRGAGAGAAALGVGATALGAGVGAGAALGGGAALGSGVVAAKAALTAKEAAVASATAAAAKAAADKLSSRGPLGKKLADAVEAVKAGRVGPGATAARLQAGLDAPYRVPGNAAALEDLAVTRANTGAIIARAAKALRSAGSLAGLGTTAASISYNYSNRDRMLEPAQLWPWARQGLANAITGARERGVVTTARAAGSWLLSPVNQLGSLFRFAGSQYRDMLMPEAPTDTVYPRRDSGDSGRTRRQLYAKALEQHLEASTFAGVFAREDAAQTKDPTYDKLKQRVPVLRQIAVEADALAASFKKLRDQQSLGTAAWDNYAKAYDEANARATQALQGINVIERVRVQELEQRQTAAKSIAELNRGYDADKAGDERDRGLRRRDYRERAQDLYKSFKASQYTAPSLGLGVGIDQMPAYLSQTLRDGQERQRELDQGQKQYTDDLKRMARDRMEQEQRWREDDKLRADELMRAITEIKDSVTSQTSGSPIL